MPLPGWPPPAYATAPPLDHALPRRTQTCSTTHSLTTPAVSPPLLLHHTHARAQARHTAAVPPRPAHNRGRVRGKEEQQRRVELGHGKGPRQRGRGSWQGSTAAAVAWTEVGGRGGGVLFLLKKRDLDSQIISDTKCFDSMREIKLNKLKFYTLMLFDSFIYVMIRAVYTAWYCL